MKPALFRLKRLRKHLVQPLAHAGNASLVPTAKDGPISISEALKLGHSMFLDKLCIIQFWSAHSVM